MPNKCCLFILTSYPIDDTKNGIFQIGEKSEAQGFNASRLPEFTTEEKIEISGSSDFLGINHYTTSLVFPRDPDSPDYDKIDWSYDSGVQSTIDKKWYM